MPIYIYIINTIVYLLTFSIFLPTSISIEHCAKLHGKVHTDANYKQFASVGKKCIITKPHLIIERFVKQRSERSCKNRPRGELSILQRAWLNFKPGTFHPTFARPTRISFEFDGICEVGVEPKFRLCSRSRTSSARGAGAPAGAPLCSRRGSRGNFAVPPPPRYQLSLIDIYLVTRRIVYTLIRGHVWGTKMKFVKGGAELWRAANSTTRPTVRIIIPRRR